MADFQQQASFARRTRDDFADALARYKFNLAYLEAQPVSQPEADENLAFDAFSNALESLVATPATKLSDLRAKAEVLWGDPASIPNATEVAHFMADLLRLTDREPSRVFRPEKWLARFERKGGMWMVRDGAPVLLVPVGTDLDGIMEELERAGGTDQVRALIKERHDAREVLQ